MTWPIPQPGLVLRYAYLWAREAAEGREEGSKDRPCAVLLAMSGEEGRTRVVVLPITHSEPQPPDEEGVEIPPDTKERLGLDAARSWVMVSEGNEFAWPGPDLRPLPGKGPESVAYGFLPPSLFRTVRDRFLIRARQRSAGLVPRTE